MMLRVCDVCDMPIKNIENQEWPDELVTPFGILRRFADKEESSRLLSGLANPGKPWDEPQKPEKRKKWELEFSINLHLCDKCQDQLLGVMQEWVATRRAEVVNLKF